MGLMMNYEHFNHEKYKMKYHIIFSTKYRKKCLKNISTNIKEYMKIAESKQNKWKIEYMEIDSIKNDHIHFMINATPTCQISEIIHSLKQISTYYAWKNNHDYLKKFYWSEKHYLWTRGYFCTTIGDVSENILKHYIENQG